ncbi:16S rRNA (cytosine1402-N4)-methyltransferase [Hydrogenivirga caldilitoris]|uniref:Ribosomal RNA small subunit methyltransferase H n=1 Tax=Hydrogenivirga caldilitoris TaxID=246264 RepID=A0A497XQZ2_9AQUI|nr:16S rRNA (cytosine(1402)-N(4))-methyltransferase RsmH [Hydrogenivirga caldilitoris]RLJ70674.1 16S rRNA (cytosine1402-N4)-methyltransferase [Hydrogenivirga caldilitoris]
MHVPVLLEESTDLLLGNGGKLYVDCTLGLGGHTKRILEKNPEAFVIGIDRDEEAIELAKETLREFEGRFAIYKADFADLDAVLEAEGIDKVDGFLFDLGVSMFQLKSERGFSFQIEAPLDMRMDREQRLTAYRVVNEYSEKELARIIWEYGEEKLSRKIARAMVEYRKKKPIETTKELADIILSVYPERLKHGRIHPATKTFQAIRIEVNRELENLKEALEKTVDRLNKGGRLVVISFHSLEDRIVKNFFREHSQEFRILTKKPITPSEEEVKMNPAARSAKLRAGERI